MIFRGGRRAPRLIYDQPGGEATDSQGFRVVFAIAKDNALPREILLSASPHDSMSMLALLFRLACSKSVFTVSSVSRNGTPHVSYWIRLPRVTERGLALHAGKPTS